MKLNNKGFAITGILYTLFVLFILVLFSVLSGMSSRKRMLESSTVKIEESFLGDDSLSSELVNAANSNSIAPVTGKYVYELVDKNGEKVECFSYIKKYTELRDINSIVFTTNSCNDYRGILDYSLKKIISFEGE